MTNKGNSSIPSPDETGVKMKKPVHQFILDWLKVFGVAAATATGLWGVFKPVSDYIDIKKREKEVVWAQEMVDQLKVLADTVGTIKQKNHAIFLLSAYELESLPFLLMELEYANADGREVIYNALKLIMNKGTVKDTEFISLIVSGAEDFFQSEYNKGDAMNGLGIQNYIFLLGKIVKNERDKAKVRKLLERLSAKTQDMNVAYRVDIETDLETTLNQLNDEF